MSLLITSGALPVLAFSTADIFVKAHKLLEYSRNPWNAVGLFGSFVFSIRFVLQWIASERAKQSIIPFGFWEVSVLGSLLLSIHFVHFGDLPGCLGSLLPLPIYARNAWFRARHKTPKQFGNAPQPVESR